MVKVKKKSIVENLYNILVNVAKKGEVITYKKLSEEYENKHGVYLNPHVGLSKPLYELAELLHENYLLPLTALVVTIKTGKPGNRFWGATPDIHSTLKTDSLKDKYLKNIYTAIYTNSWAPYNLLKHCK